MIAIETIETDSLGDRSYLVHDGQVAAVIDPQRDIDRVLGLAERIGVRIVHVFETHVHNDYVSGGYEIARQTGAVYHVHVDDEVHFEADGLDDGDVVSVGVFSLRAVHTPGHTPTHLSYVLHADERDQAVFTGGSMLYGTVGRTDLISRARADELTRAQYRSVRRLGELLPDDAGVHPTHGFGSFCSSSQAETPDTSTIGREREANIALTTDDIDAFVEGLLSGLDAYPRYYAHMAPRNLLGPEPVDLSPPVPADAAELGARMHAGEWVVDLRDRVAYAADHLAGTVNVPLEDSFSTYVGWLMPWGRPLTLIGDSPEAVAEAQRQLVRIGIDRPAAAASGALDAISGDLSRRAYDVVDFAAVKRASSDDDEDPLILDVRRDDEWDDGRLEGARHIPLHELERRMGELPTDRTVWVHCESGFRSSIAASLVDRSGRQAVLIDDEFSKAVELGLTA